MGTKSDLDDINENVDRRIDGQHEVVPLGEQICPRRPKPQLSVFEHLVTFVDVRDQLCKVAQEKHEDNPCEKTCHCRISSMTGGDGVVKHIGPVIRNVEFFDTKTESL